MAQALFDKVFAIVVGTEGGFTNDPKDPGNWTGGSRNVGALKGTKFGISAAAYPALDIEGLTIGDAQSIYRKDYWGVLDLDGTHPAFALLMFDSAVNNGVARATTFLQVAADVTPIDGAFGPITRKARDIHLARDPIALCEEILARRIDFSAKDADWRDFGLGWSRRFARLPWNAMRLTKEMVA